MVASSTTNSAFLPGARSRANPYATTVHDSTVPTIVPKAMMTVLIENRPKGTYVSASRKFDHFGGLGIHTGGNASTW